MTDYSEKTDEEINYKVGGAMGIEQSYQVPDYCNDWAAIGPIIEKYEIDLDFYRSMNGWYASGMSEYSKMAEAPNPKRAAAICFLMMQGEG